MVTQFIRGDSYQIIANAMTAPVGGANDAVVLTLVGAIMMCFYNPKKE